MQLKKFWNVVHYCKDDHRSHKPACFAHTTEKNLCADFGTIKSHNLNPHNLNSILAAMKRLHIIKVCQWTIQVVFSELGQSSPMYNMGIFQEMCYCMKKLAYHTS